MAFATINKSSSYFNTILYTGDATSPRSITGVGFQPDLTWVKNRSQAGSNGWYDVVRGAGAANNLSTDSTNAAPGGDAAGYGFISSFNSDGFSVTAGTVGSDITNKSGSNYVDWNWLGSNTTTSNTAGSISSTVSVNTTSGFSIVKYTGTGSLATVGHGLGVAPAMFIIKRYDGGNGGQWNVYHQSLGNTKVIYLNSTDAPDTTATRWNNTSPTSTVFTINTSGDVNNSSSNHIAYCFAEIKGYSKFSSYTGNGNANGTFVYTGFKPAFVMIKSTSAGNSWHLLDNKRSPYNIATKYFGPNSNAPEQTYNVMDFCSSGFKLRDSDPTFNNSGTQFIYMAFAENPFVLTDGTPVTAR